MSVVIIQAGNSDDRLSQVDWSSLCEDMRTQVKLSADHLIGEWHSLPDSRWQNACWMLTLTDPRRLEALRFHVGFLCQAYRQQSIAWTEAPETRFVGPNGDFIEWEEGAS